MINNSILKSGAILAKKKQAGSGVACDLCTGGLVFSWHMEDLNVTNGDPCGCSLLGDLVGSANGDASLTSDDKSDGSKCVYVPPTDAYYEFDMDSNFPYTEGTLWLDIRFILGAYIGSNFRFLSIRNVGSLRDGFFLRFVGYGSNVGIRADFVGNSNIQYLTTPYSIDDSLDKWWRIKYQWKPSATGAGHRLDVWELDSSDPREVTGSAIVAGPEDTLTPFITSSAFTLNLGFENNTEGHTVYYDNIKIYNTSTL
jgi:hypothetical protein